MTAGGVMESGPGGRIGPNAITRVIEALAMLVSPGAMQRLFTAAGLERYLREAPTQMVDEAEVARLHHVLHDHMGDDLARKVGRAAGERTAEYLLQRRIPRFAQVVLRCCGAPIASRLLARAIAGNAWTFVGTGRFSAQHGRPTRFVIDDCPICRGEQAAQPYCDFYAGTFERLYRKLVHRDARVAEVACHARGDPACVFEIRWDRRRPGAD
jgi:divinyl protochlorophyllide a 8-vinyl-reductase